MTLPSTTRYDSEAMSVHGATPLMIPGAPQTAPATRADATQRPDALVGSMSLAALARVSLAAAGATALGSTRTRLLQATIQQCLVVVYNGCLFYRVRMRGSNGIGVAWVDAGSGQEKALAVYPPVTADQPWPESDYNVAKGLKGTLKVAALARVTPAQADGAALDAVGGGVPLRTRLHGLHGYLLYTVTVRTAARSLRSVHVDAGTAQILGVVSGFPKADGLGTAG